MKTSASKINRKLILNFFSIVLISTILLSCSEKASNNPNIDYSENGIRLAGKIVSVYQDLTNKLENQKYEQEFVKILNDISPETYMMRTGKNDEHTITEHIFKLNAFRSLQKAFTAYNLQLDPNISTSSSNLQSKIKMACNALDSIKLDEELLLKKNQLEKNINGSSFRIDEAIFSLTDLYSEIWNEESQKWFVILENHQIIFENGIKSISVNAFNVEKIKIKINEPYNNSAVLANLYKLNMIKESQQLKSDLETQMHAISESFNLMLQVQGEMMKRKKNKLKIQELNNSLEILVAN